MKKIGLLKKAGDFAENKDIARELRLDEITPELEKGNKIELDFKGVTSATQSFIHALISQIIRDKGVDVLDNISFKNCNSKVKTVIEIVVEYVQDGIYSDIEENESLDPEVTSNKTPMENLTKGYEEFSKGKKINPHGKESFNKSLAKSIKSAKPRGSK